MANVHTWQGRIHSVNGYSGHYVTCEGPNTAAGAKEVFEARYPGAKISGVKCIDSQIWGEKEKQKREETRANRTSAAEQTQQSINNSFSGGVTSSGTHSVSYNNTNSGEGSSLSGADVGGLLILAAIGIGGFVAYALAPLVGMFGGAFVGYKYGSKFTQEKNFHLRFWIVLISTISLMVGGTVAGSKLHEVTNFGGDNTQVEQIVE